MGKAREVREVSEVSQCMSGWVVLYYSHSGQVGSVVPAVPTLVGQLD